MAVTSLRAACRPIETRSYCIVGEGMESIEAGTASRLSGRVDASGGVMGDHQARIHTCFWGKERG